MSVINPLPHLPVTRPSRAPDPRPRHG